MWWPGKKRGVAGVGVGLHWGMDSPVAMWPGRPLTGVPWTSSPEPGPEGQAGLDLGGSALECLPLSPSSCTCTSWAPGLRAGVTSSRKGFWETVPAGCADSGEPTGDAPGQVCCPILTASSPLLCEALVHLLGRGVDFQRFGNVPGPAARKQQRQGLGWAHLHVDLSPPITPCSHGPWRLGSRGLSRPVRLAAPVPGL